jgi:hypothetical protein
MYRKSLVGAAALTLLFGAPADAHHPSGVSSTGGAGPINTLSATPLEQGQSAAAIFFEIVKMNPFSDAELTAPGTHHPHSLDAILAPSLGYAYGSPKDLTVSARLPYLQRTDIREGHVHGGVPLVEDLGNSSGIGDLTLLSQYRFFNNRASRFEAALLLGVKAPTGKTDTMTDTGERFETEFQPGSGSWDGLFGVAVTQRFGGLVVRLQRALRARHQGRAADRPRRPLPVQRGHLLPPGRRLRRRVARCSSAHCRSRCITAGPAATARPRATRTTSRPPRAGPALDLVLELNGEWHDRQTVAGVRTPTAAATHCTSRRACACRADRCRPSHRLASRSSIR